MRNIGLMFCFVFIVGVMGCAEEIVGVYGTQVTIKVDPEDSSKLVVEPVQLHLSYGSEDIIAFSAVGTDAILHFEDPILFGKLEYKIATGETLKLKVQKDVPRNTYNFSVDDGEQALSKTQDPEDDDPCVIID